MVLSVTTVAASRTKLVQDFLVRSVYLQDGTKGIQKANNYRISTYTDITWTNFMGKGIAMHKKVVVPLKCVEKEIKNTCSGEYIPQVLSGWRTRNTIKGHEISSHVFGIAIDIDPALNPCCGCVAEGGWQDVPRCKNAQTFEDGSAPLGDYEIPQCWIKSFEKYGWYWLGEDPTLRDTMHFEFLAKPGTISCE